MKDFSEQPVKEEPIYKISQLPHGEDFPHTYKPFSLFFHSLKHEFFINTDQWFQIPFGGYDMITSIKSAFNIKKFKGSSIPCTLGGTYLVDSGKEKNKKIMMPSPGMVQGITYNIKNVGDNRFLLCVGEESSIDDKQELVVHPKQCVTLQCLKNNWYIINMYLSADL